MTVQIDTTAVNAAVRLQNQGSNPSSPASGFSTIFSRGDGLYYESASGTVIGPMSTGTMDLADPYGIFHRLDAVNANDDEFIGASINSAWVQVNPNGSVTWVQGNHVLSAAFNGQTANHIGAILKPVTLSDGQAFETSLFLVAQKVATKFVMAGLVITDGTGATANAMALMYYIDFDANVCNIEMWKGTLSNLNTGGTANPFSFQLATSPVRLKILRNSSTSFSPLISTRDGAQFNAFGAAVMNPGFTPTDAGLFVSAWGSGKAGLAAFDYFRITS